MPESGEVVAIARQRVVGRKAPGWLKVEIKDLVGGKGAVVDADVVKLACEERIIPAFCIRRGARTRFASDDERVVVPIGDAGYVREGGPTTEPVVQEPLERPFAFVANDDVDAPVHLE